MGQNRQSLMSSRLLTNLRCLLFISGVIMGTSIGFMIVSFNHLHAKDRIDEQFIHGQSDEVFIMGDVFQGRQPRKTLDDADGQNINDTVIVRQDTDSSDVAENLRLAIRIVCWVWCTGRDIQNQTLAIHKTWGRKCDKVLIFTDLVFPNITSINFPDAGVDYSTSRYIMAFRYVYKHYYEDGDWFFGTFDETYVCMENLRLFLKNKNTSDPFYFGHRLLLEDINIEFVDARVGCVLSKASLRLLGTLSLHKNECNHMDPAGEKQLGACLNNIGAKIGDSVDSLGKTRFLSYAPSILMQGSLTTWYIQQDQEGLGKGVESISKYAITFSGMTSFFMYGVESYLYHMRPFGVFPIDREL